MTETAPGAEPDYDSEMYELKARCYELHMAKGFGIRDVAKVLQAEGVKISASSVYRYSREVAAELALVPWLKREGVRDAQAVGLRAMRAWIHSDIAATSGKSTEYVPILLKVYEAERKLFGLDSVNVNVLDRSPVPSERILAALDTVRAELDNREDKI